jgi:hypothetical protein
MGHLGREFRVPELDGLDRDQGIALLDRAAEVGLLTPHGSGYYTIHPAVPWYFQRLFGDHYSDDQAEHAEFAYASAIASLGSYYHRRYTEGDAGVAVALAGEEENLLKARRLARSKGLWIALIGLMQGLRVLYEHTGRSGEWARLVRELEPDLIDPNSELPKPGREDQWSIFTDYRVRLAQAARDWQAAERLQRLVVDWDRGDAAAALELSPDTLDDSHRNTIHNLAASLERLATVLVEQGQPACVDYLQEALSLAQRISDRQAEATVAHNLGYAYLGVASLCDLDQAERWYRHSLELTDEGDHRTRAACMMQLGRVALQRFRNAAEEDAPAEERSTPPGRRR